MTKLCTKCLRELELSQFSTDKRTKTGLTSWCLNCFSESSARYVSTPDGKARKAAISRAWYKRNRERALARSHEYHERNKEKRRLKNRESRLLRKYKLSLKQYQDLLEKQGEKCAICQRGVKEVKTQKKPLLVVDHDHRTGEIRGLLCDDCNTGIGRLADDPVRVKAALEYLGGII